MEEATGRSRRSASSAARLDRLLANQRYQGNFLVYGPGVSSWMTHQTPATNNSPRVLLRYLAEHPAS